MRLTKLTLIWVLGLLTLFYACDKDPKPQEPSCSDGILNNGESGVDCGGPCAPCPPFTGQVFFAIFNGELTNFNQVQVAYGDTIHIAATTDSVQVNLIFKNLTVPDETSQLNPLIYGIMPLVTYNDVEYTQFDSTYTVVVLTKNENNKLSGLFQLRLPHGLNNMDTLRVINGTFENLPY